MFKVFEILAGVVFHYFVLADDEWAMTAVTVFVNGMHTTRFTS